MLVFLDLYRDHSIILAYNQTVLTIVFASVKSLEVAVRSHPGVASIINK